MASQLADALKQLGFLQVNAFFFDTLKINYGKHPKDIFIHVKTIAEKNEINFRYFDEGHVGIALDETTSEKDVHDIIHVFEEAVNAKQHLHLPLLNIFRSH